MLGVWLKDTKCNKIFLWFLIVTNPMINYSSLQVVFTDLWLHFNQLVKTNHTIYIISNLLIAFSLQIDKPREKFLVKIFHTLFCKLQANVIILHLELWLSSNPVSFHVEFLKIQDLLIIFSNFHVFLQMKIDNHQQVMNVWMRGMNRIEIFNLSFDFL